MILTIIFASMLAFGIIEFIVSNLINKYHPTKSTSDWFDIICIALCVVGLIANLFTVGFVIENNVMKQQEFEEAVYEKQVLEHRLEQIELGTSVTGNELVYNDVVDFNNNLRSVKRWANNPWTSWFNNQLIADNIDYIEIPNMINNFEGGET